MILFLETLLPGRGKQPQSATALRLTIRSPNEYLLGFHRAAPRVALNSSSPGSPLPPGDARPTANLTWVVVGDSRVRQVFSALVTRLSSPRLRYKKPSTMASHTKHLHMMVTNRGQGRGTRFFFFLAFPTLQKHVPLPLHLPPFFCAALRHRPSRLGRVRHLKMGMIKTNLA